MSRFGGSVIVQNDIDLSRADEETRTKMVAAYEIVKDLWQIGILEIESQSLPWQMSKKYDWNLKIPSEQERWRNGDD